MLPEQLSNEAVVAICSAFVGALQIVNIVLSAALHRCLDAHRTEMRFWHRQNIGRLRDLRKTANETSVELKSNTAATEAISSDVKVAAAEIINNTAKAPP